MTMAPTDAERLLALLREPCCPICILARRAAREYLETRLLRLSTGASQGPKALYEQDPPMVSGAVLCSRHWHKLVALEARHPGVPRLSEAMLETLLETADDPRICLACGVQQSTTRRYLEVLAGLPAETVGLALRQGQGFICLKHLAALPASPLKGWLLERVHALTLDLPHFQERYARWHSTEFGPEAELDPPGRALAALAGED